MNSRKLESAYSNVRIDGIIYTIILLQILDQIYDLNINKLLQPIFIHFYLICPAKGTCETIEGTKCQFPFHYRGKTFKRCTKERYHRKWCMTKEAEGEWAECRHSCNLDEGIMLQCELAIA